MTYAKVIRDSISPAGHRLTTMEVRFHRFVLAEFNTHRVFSRNSSSSRAIPFYKQVERIEEDPAYPVEWASEQSGMQGGDELGATDRRSAHTLWEKAKNNAVYKANQLSALGVHKSLVNRLLEPFMWHTVIVTSTAWENFFEQRVSELAQPEIHEAARQMLVAYDTSQPQALKFGEYHLPYVDHEDEEELSEAEGVPVLENLIKVSVARCARVSYLTHDGNRDLSKDISLYNRLVQSDPPHWSPLEHVAIADVWNVRSESLPTRDRLGNIIFETKGNRATVDLPKVGNFVGWTQQRHIVEQQQGVNTYA